MKKFNKITGDIGEIKAQNFLKKKKYKLLETNYSCALGEIDIIALQKDVIVFVEVKTRTSEDFGRPCEAVTPYKQNKIRSVASYYLMLKGWTERNARFDVIEVLDDEINHIENAF